MTVNRLPDYLDHMRQAIADAQSFTEGMAQADFHICRATQSNPLAEHAGHAQPDCTWLFRHQP